MQGRLQSTDWAQTHQPGRAQQPGPLLITRRTQIRNNSRHTASCESEGPGTLLYNTVAVAWSSIGLLPDQVCVNSQLFSDSCAFTLFMSSVQCSSILKSSARISDIPAVTGDTAETLQWTAVARSHYCSRHTDHCTAALQLQTVTYNTHSTPDHLGL